MNSGVALGVAVVLLALNAFFVGAEFAVMSTRRAQIEPQVESGKWGAKAALWALEHVSLMLATAQLGVTLCSTGLGMVTEPAIARLVEGPLVELGLPAASAHMVGFGVALIIVVFMHVVFGEIIPKNLSISAPDKVILILAPVLVRIAQILGPVVRLMDHTANLFLRIFGVEPRSEISAAYTAEEVASIVEVSQAEGVLTDDIGLLSGALEFSEETAGSVMVKLEDLVTVPLDITPVEMEQLIARTGFSRFPVVNKNGDLAGYLHLKDILFASEAEREKPLPVWRIRELGQVETDTEVEEALAQMRQSGIHLAEVCENGKTIGIVFLEDILEELVGEVRDYMQRTQY